MLVDQQFVETVALEADVPTWISDLGALIGQSVSDYRRYFTEPFEAIRAAWDYDHNTKSEFMEHLRGIFPEALAARCGCSPDKLLGDPRIAFGVFMSCLEVSLRAWRSEPPPESLYGSVAAHWCTRHPEVFSRVQEAHRLRASYPQIGEADWTLAEVLAGGASKEPPKSKKLELGISVHLAGQRTWTQAAQTAAYALFGDFLLTEAESTGFCKHCAMPFLRGQKKLFCSLKCARIHSALQAREVKTKISRCKTFRKAAKALTKWLQVHRSAGLDWRMKIQNAAGMQTRDGRQNRTLGAYIRASRTSVGSPEREKLLHSLQEADTISKSGKGSKEHESLRSELDAFFRNIQSAEVIRQSSY